MHVIHVLLLIDELSLACMTDISQQSSFLFRLVYSTSYGIWFCQPRLLLAGGKGREGAGVQHCWFFYLPEWHLKNLSLDNVDIMHILGLFRMFDDLQNFGVIWITLTCLLNMVKLSDFTCNSMPWSFAVNWPIVGLKFSLSWLFVKYITSLLRREVEGCLQMCLLILDTLIGLILELWLCCLSHHFRGSPTQDTIGKMLYSGFNFWHYWFSSRDSAWI